MEQKKKPSLPEGRSASGPCDPDRGWSCVNWSARTRHTSKPALGARRPAGSPPRGPARPPATASARARRARPATPSPPRSGRGAHLSTTSSWCRRGRRSRESVAARPRDAGSQVANPGPGGGGVGRGQGEGRGPGPPRPRPGPAPWRCAPSPAPHDRTPGRALRAPHPDARPGGAAPRLVLPSSPSAGGVSAAPALPPRRRLSQAGGRQGGDRRQPPHPPGANGSFPGVVATFQSGVRAGRSRVRWQREEERRERPLGLAERLGTDGGRKPEAGLVDQGRAGEVPYLPRNFSAAQSRAQAALTPR